MVSSTVKGRRRYKRHSRRRSQLLSSSQSPSSWSLAERDVERRSLGWAQERRIKAHQSADERRREEEEKRRFDSAKAERAIIKKAQAEARERAERAAVLRAQENEDEENDEDEDESDEDDEGEDISFFTNRAAVYLERGKYDECIQDCDKDVERGRELRSDYKMVARALTRKGTTLAKMAKSSKDYDVAIE
ncbi:hypothetical protein Droror1_Dr00000450 [Drosera rotundifolia]